MAEVGEQQSDLDFRVISSAPIESPCWVRGAIANYLTRAELALHGMIVTYIIVGYLAAFAVGRMQDVSLFNYSSGLSSFVVPVVIIALCARVAYIMVRIVPDQLFVYVAKDLKDTLFCRQRLFQCVPLTLLLICFISVFTSLKGMIPSFHAYNWDESWMVLDRFLHFGRQPWELMQPLFGKPVITYLLNVSYNIWFFVMLLFLLWQVFSLSNRFLRMQYLFTFVLIWAVGGNVLASILASAGPCYYDTFVHGLNPYAGLMEYLQQTNSSYEIWALNAQQILLEKYSGQEMGVGMGISAMPSMHVATATLFALFALQIHRLFGYLMVLYAVLIYLGSIHLAWHYAVDGVAGALLAILIWFGVGQLLRRDGRLCSKIESSGDSQSSAS